MRLSVVSCLIGAVSLFSPLALAQQSQLTFYKSKSICKTRLDDTSTSSVPTTTKFVTKTKNLTFTTTSTPTSKYTPGPVTKTSTSTVYTTTTKTGTTPTKTITVTSTATRVTTITAPTSTVPETEVVFETIYFTTTVPIEPLYTPILDSLPGAGPPPAQKRAKKLRRTDDLLDKRQSSSNTAAQYPRKVKCNVVTKVFVITIVKKVAPTKTITVKPSTVYSTATTTVTRTSTSHPPNTYTTVISTTTSVSSTTTTPVYTSTETLTETLLVAVATYYPQCAPNSRNFAQTVDGAKILSDTIIYPGGDSYFQTTSEINTAQGCCEACTEDDDCGATYFYNRDGFPIQYPCNFLSRTDSTCDPANPLLLAVRTGTFDVDAYHDLASNNKCGKFTTAYGA